MPVRSVLEALRLDARKDLELPAGEEDWRQALAFADHTQLTLALRARLAASPLWDRVPPEVRARLDRNLADNTTRLDRIQAAFQQIVDGFEAAGVEFLVLKGLSHSPSFIADPRMRVQYDMDFYCPPEVVCRARNVVAELGYKPVATRRELPVDHLPAMVRKTGWRWRGNFFDPEMPVAVDLHFRLWDFETERLAAPGTEQFWQRRVEREISGRRVCELAAPDQLGYAALHAVRHLFRGSLRLWHVYEITHFLDNHKDDAALWRRWAEWHAPDLRTCEQIAFRLAQLYFSSPAPDPRPPAPARSPAPAIEAWFERYGWSPVEAMFVPNKDELLLHLSLIASRADRWRVMRRRLMPLRPPAVEEAVYEPEQTTRGQLRKLVRYVAFLARRAIHHGRLLVPALWRIATWERQMLPIVKGSRVARPRTVD